MNSIQGPGIFFAQFMRDHPPYNDIRTLAPWAASLGYKGLQLPAGFLTWKPPFSQRTRSPRSSIATGAFARSGRCRAGRCPRDGCKGDPIPQDRP